MNVFKLFLVDCLLQLPIVFEAANRAQEWPEFLFLASSIPHPHFPSPFPVAALEMMSFATPLRSEFLLWQRDGLEMEKPLQTFLGILFVFITSGAPQQVDKTIEIINFES